MYVPVLRVRKAEVEALAGVPENRRSEVWPLFVVVPVGEGRGRPLTPEQQIWENAQDIMDGWMGPCYVDVEPGHMSFVTKFGRHSLVDIVEQVRLRTGQAVVPVGRLQASVGPGLVGLAARQGAGGVCLRLSPQEWMVVGRDGVRRLTTRIARFLDGCEAGPYDSDVVLDVRPPSETADVARAAAELRAWLEVLPFRDQWRRVTLASGAFPPMLGSVPGLTSHARPALVQAEADRTDWLLWRSLENQSPSVCYADYGVVAPVYSGRRGFPRFPTLRWAGERHWTIIRWTAVRGEGYSGFREVCLDLASRTDFDSAHCGAETAVLRIVDREASPSGGGASEWLRMGFAHHFQVTLDALAAGGG